jgi:hypothetical protein
METVIGHWDLITFINITELTKEFDFLEYDFKQFKKLCINATTGLDDFIPLLTPCNDRMVEDHKPQLVKSNAMNLVYYTVY